MIISEKLLEVATKLFSSPPVVKQLDNNSEPNSIESNLEYALKKQFQLKFFYGFPFEIIGKNILEIGCGQGGISTYLAVNGADYVCGADINEFHLSVAEIFKKQIAEKFKIDLSSKLSFKIEDAYKMTFESETFDLIIADNVFEHFMEPEKVLRECYRVLKPGGLIIIPNFNSYYSKYGAHLKYGLKLPWVNLFFSEKTICRTLYKMSITNPFLKKAYPGISDNTTRIVDLREYKDLNGMSFSKFKKITNEVGFSIKSFVISPPFRKGKMFFSLIYKFNALKYSAVSDVLSIGASCVLAKK